MLDKNCILKEAQNWLSCVQEGKNIYLNEEFLSWIKNEEHKKIFEEEKLFRQMFLNLPKEDKEKLSNQVKEELKKERFLNKIKIITPFVACFMIVIFVYIFHFKDNFSQNIYSENKIIQDILMPDNSKITLDAKTNIKVAYSKNKREVFLEKGKALFEVSPNKQKPFFVKSDDIFVKVVGTKFEVNKKQDRVNISVLEGIVDINHNDLKVTQLKKGDVLEIKNDGKIEKLGKVSVDKMASWENEKLIFHQTPLFEVINEFSKYTNKNIELNLKKIDRYLITGEFNIYEFDKFVKLLPYIYPIKVEQIEQNRVILKN
ncbi:FecR family protein [Aliarcobacter butzleri]|uniref:FecR family protein n=1 Tax=Aliarcobacter butzleri TaxID=28197 RepID=UPI002B250584|nr:FecR domain-containing protein [Aliarcobacter butzleri]